MDKAAPKGMVFNIQRYSLDDGTGIRTCVFLKGCPLRCQWCHNAESQSFRREIAYRAEDCIGCGGCAAVCPVGAHRLDTRKVHSYDRTVCESCGACAQGCPTEALELVGQEMTVEDVLRKVRRDSVFYAGGGGMTITGGEPMAQPDFSAALAKAAKAEGIGVVVETSGFASRKAFASIAPYVDCFYFDCKADSERHEFLTGVKDEVILQNLSLLNDLGCLVELRCPIVPEGNLSEAFLEKIIRLANAYPAIRGVTLLPYHAVGSEKSLYLGGTEQKRFRIPDAKMMNALRKQLAERVPVAVR